MATLNIILQSLRTSRLLYPTSAKTISKNHYSTNPNNHYDIIVAGGGMVGTTLACTLGQNSQLSQTKILLLEGGTEKSLTVPEKYSNRVVSLNPGTVNLLEDIGAWKLISKARYAPVKKLQVWDGVSDAMITFEDNVVSYIVENDVLLGAVNNIVKDIANVSVIYSSKIKDYQLQEYETERSEVTLENGSKYTCNLLLGCDGANSQVRKAMQVQYLNWNYNQMGVVATLKLEGADDNDIAWQRFLPTGPIALLPLNKQLSSLVWSTTPEDAKCLLKLSDGEFVDALNEALWKSFKHSNIVDQITSGFSNALRFLNLPSDIMRQLPPKICGCEENSRAAFPLGFGHSTNYIRKGVALVGDAAHRMHPLAGQGVNLGFGDVVQLNKVLGDAVYNGGRIDDLSYLKDYETQRQRHNVPTMLAVDGLHRLYSTDFTPVVILRSLGLQATHVLNPLKKAIISHAAV